MGRLAAVVERRGLHGRALLRRGVPVAGGRRAAAASRGDRPVVTGSDYYEGWIYQGGAFQLGFNLFWVQLMADPRGANKIDELYRHRPLATVSIPDPKYARIYREWLDHPTDDAYWQALSINRRYGRVARTGLNVGGWYDIFLRGTLENFVACSRRPARSAPAGDSGC